MIPVSGYSCMYTHCSFLILTYKQSAGVLVSWVTALLLTANDFFRID